MKGKYKKIGVYIVFIIMVVLSFIIKDSNISYWLFRLAFVFVLLYFVFDAFKTYKQGSNYKNIFLENAEKYKEENTEEVTQDIIKKIHNYYSKGQLPDNFDHIISIQIALLCDSKTIANQLIEDIKNEGNEKFVGHSYLYEAIIELIYNEDIEEAKSLIKAGKIFDESCTYDTTRESNAVKRILNVITLMIKFVEGEANYGIHDLKKYSKNDSFFFQTMLLWSLKISKVNLGQSSDVKAINTLLETRVPNNKRIMN